MSELTGEKRYDRTGTCDSCASGGKPVRLSDPNDGNSAYVCQRCDKWFAACTVAVVEHIKATQDRCGTRLCQVDKSVQSQQFGPIADVDLGFLVNDVLTAYFKADQGGPTDG